jgi:hypothetical protein
MSNGNKKTKQDGKGQTQQTTIRLPKELYKKFRLYCIQHDYQLGDRIVEMIRREVGG